MKCEECGKYSYNENVCVNCGLVVNSKPITKIPERITDKTSEFKSREYLGNLSPYNRIQTRTFLTSKNRDYNRMFSKCNNLKNEVKMRNYMTAFMDIGRICSFLQLRTIVKEESLNIYKSIVKIEPKFFGQKYHKFIGHAACICVACDKYCEIYSFKEMCELIRSTDSFKFVLKKLKKVYCEIVQMFDLPNSNKDNPNYISYIGNTLKLPQEFITIMHRIYNNIKHIFQSQFMIKGYILGMYAIYTKSFGITIKTLGEIFKISTPTIANRRNEIKGFLNRRIN